MAWILNSGRKDIKSLTNENNENKMLKNNRGY